MLGMFIHAGLILSILVDAHAKQIIRSHIDARASILQVSLGFPEPEGDFPKQPVSTINGSSVAAVLAEGIQKQSTKNPASGYVLKARSVEYCHSGTHTVKSGIAPKPASHSCCQFGMDSYKTKKIGASGDCVDVCNSQPDCKYISRVPNGWCTLSKDCAPGDLRSGSYDVYEKVSIKGPAGPRGAAGAAGRAGPPGAKGATGAKGKDGTSVNRSEVQAMVDEAVANATKSGAFKQMHWRLASCVLPILASSSQ